MEKIKTLKRTTYWFSFTKNGSRICLTKKADLRFSFRIGKRKYLTIGDWCFYILKPNLL